MQAPPACSKRNKVYKFVACSRRLARWSHSEAESRVANISIDLLGVRSWRHSDVTSGGILALPGKATSSAMQILWCTIMFYSKVRLTSALYRQNLAFL